jgi:hypothetical protein
LSRHNTDINHPANGPIIPELVERSLEMKVLYSSADEGLKC